MMVSNLYALQNHDKNASKWFVPLRVGVEYSNITHIGPVIQYNVFKTFHVTCKLEYNTNIDKLFVLPGIKYNFKNKYYGLNPFIELQYSKLDHIKYNKLFYDGKEVIRYCNNWDYDPLSGVSTCISWVEGKSSEKTNYNGAALFAGIEYPINNMIINMGLGTSYIPKIERSNKDKFFTIYVIGIYYSFSSQ